MRTRGRSRKSPNVSSEDNMGTTKKMKNASKSTVPPKPPKTKSSGRLSVGKRHLNSNSAEESSTAGETNPMTPPNPDNVTSESTENGHEKEDFQNEQANNSNLAIMPGNQSIIFNDKYLYCSFCVGRELTLNPSLNDPQIIVSGVGFPVQPEGGLMPSYFIQVGDSPHDWVFNLGRFNFKKFGGADWEWFKGGEDSLKPSTPKITSTEANFDLLSVKLLNLLKNYGTELRPYFPYGMHSTLKTSFVAALTSQFKHLEPKYQHLLLQQKNGSYIGAKVKSDSMRWPSVRVSNNNLIYSNSVLTNFHLNTGSCLREVDKSNQGQTIQSPATEAWNQRGHGQTKQSSWQVTIFVT